MKTNTLLPLLAAALGAALLVSAQVANYTPKVSITLRDNQRVIAANGIPDHTPGQFPNRGNPNRISEQQHNFTVPAKPQQAAQLTGADRGWFGVALNGVPFEAGTAEFWSRDWKYEAIGGSMNLGLDEHRAHVQPTGAYHYHGLPTGLITKLGGDGKKMLLIGWAGDGFPIYTSYAYADANDPKSALRPMKPSHRLKTGARPGNPSGPGGKFDGAFTADYEFVKGSGDLDEANGRFGVTPEFPNGIYHYFATDTYPYLPRCLKGTTN